MDTTKNKINGKVINWKIFFLEFKNNSIFAVYLLLTQRKFMDPGITLLKKISHKNRSRVELARLYGCSNILRGKHKFHSLPATASRLACKFNCAE